MRIGRTNVEDQVYTMNNILTKTEKEKDRSVVIDNELKISGHLSEKVNKANIIVGIIRGIFVNLDMFKTMYTALPRPHLQYANRIWSKVLT